MEPITLSDELIDAMQQVIIQHDARADDAGIAIQYFAAVMGYTLSKQQFPAEQKSEFLEQLCEFARHVFNDCEKNQPVQAPEEAMGKWRPGDS